MKDFGSSGNQAKSKNMMDWPVSVGPWHSQSGSDRHCSTENRPKKKKLDNIY
jgi:hypothetical protein